MKPSLFFILALCAGLYGPPASAEAHKPEQISVGYLQQWPTPSQFSQATRTFDRALGISVNWIPFDDGAEMQAALASGRVQLAYALGLVPFVIGVSSGIDLTMIGIAVGYPPDDNCIVAADSAIDRASAQQLEGSRVAVQVGSFSHYRLLRMLRHLGVDSDRVEILPSASGDDAEQALRGGDVVMACAAGSALAAMTDFGTPLMSAAEQEQIGLRGFDIVSVVTDFMHQHPELVQAFMDVIEASNEQWRSDPEPMRAAIARSADMDPAGAARRLETFRFPSALEQKSENWLGGEVSAYSKDIADFFVAQGRLGGSLDSYASHITTRFLR